MHEFALAQNIFDLCMKTADHYNAKKITQISLELGDFTLVIDNLLKRSLNILMKDSIAEGANIEIKRTAGVLNCMDCNKTSEIWFEEEKRREEDEEKTMEKYENEVASVSGVSGYQFLGINLFKCRHCGSRNTDLTGGKEVTVKNIKIEE